MGLLLPSYASKKFCSGTYLIKGVINITWKEDICLHELNFLTQSLSLSKSKTWNAARNYLQGSERNN